MPARRRKNRQWPCSSRQWGEAEVIAGGTDLLSLMKDHIVTPKRVVNLKEIRDLQGMSYSAAAGLRVGRAGDH